MVESSKRKASDVGRKRKVSAAIEEYRLVRLGEELERRWTSQGADHASLRELAAFVNKRILEKAMEDAGLRMIEGDVDNYYGLLVEQDEGVAERTRLVRRLEREGVEVEALQDAFVSYQAVRSFLLEERGAEYTREPKDPLQSVDRTVQKLIGRTEAVTVSKLKQLRDSNSLTIGDFDVIVDVKVICRDCGSTYQVGDLVDSGGCRCSDES